MKNCTYCFFIHNLLYIQHIEYPDWNDTRDSLENTLIKKCLKFALAVVKKFEANQHIIIEDAIKQKISNHDLVDAYTSLGRY